MAKTEILLAPAHSSVRAHRWKWGAIGLIGIAQAAAILVVVGLTWQRPTGSREPSIAEVAIPSSFGSALPPPTKVSGLLSVPVVEIDEGRLVVIHVEGSAAKIVDMTPQAATFRLEKRLRNLESALVDDWLLMLNEVESMTKPLVAMKE